MPRRTLVFIAAMVVLAFVVALPALAGQPSWAQGRNDQARNDKVKVEKTPITITGVVETATDADGVTIYQLTDDGTTYTLDAGPPWFFGAGHPLAPYVGAVVTIDGEIAEGETEVDVQAVDGQALRAAGKPPWAGGWKHVGEAHPGWSQQKADRFELRFGDCFPPGHCKSESTPEE